MRRLLLAGLLALAGCGGTTFVDSSPPGEEQSFRSGWSTVDPIAVTIPRGEPVVDGQVRESDGTAPILVNVWASWCVPCAKELPLLERISASGALQVVGLSRDVRTTYAREALEEAGVGYENWMDTGAEFAIDLDGRIPLAHVPASALIVGGKVVAVHLGEFESRSDVLAGLDLVNLS